MQLSFAKPTKADLILRVLSDGRWHSGAEFLSGDNSERVRCSSYSQRIGQLAKTHRIERDRCGEDGLARYRLVRGSHE